MATNPAGPDFPQSPLVDIQELHQELTGDPAARPVVLDVRYSPGRADGREQHARGHVPGAVFLDLETVLAGPRRPDGVGGRHPLPSAEAFEEGMRAAGASADRDVVVYDDWSSVAAARAWWLLRYFGHERVRVLDGGWKAWVAAGLPVSTGSEVPEPGDLQAEPGHRRVITADEAARYAHSAVLVDSRPADRFRGENETMDPVAGHIPGAVSVPALENVDDQGRFLPNAVLAERLRAAGVVDGNLLATYCGSGVQACHLALAAAASDVAPDAAVYVGSWSDWISDPSRPVA